MEQVNQAELIQLLKDTNEYLRKRNKDQQKQIQQLSQSVENLNETVRYLNNKLFGISSEKTKLKSNNDVAPEQQNIYNETEATADESVEEPTAEIAVAGYIQKNRKKKSIREDILEKLPVTEVICYAHPDDKNCSYCNTEMKLLGIKFIREELKITPAKVERIHYMQEVYICPQCKQDDEPFIVSAETPTPLMKHSLASPSTVAHVMYQKYVNAMPLYRQAKDWEQMGVKLPRATLANWVNKCGINYMKPVYELLHKHLLERKFINCDETPCQVLKEEGKPATSKSYMWLYASGNDGLAPIRLYEYQPGRSGDYAVAFLKGFSGYLCCDGYSGYNKLKDVVRCGCLAHMRRYWFDAIPAERKKAKTKNLPPIPAEIGLEYCNQLFELEDQFKELDPDKRKELRLQTEVPIWKAYWAWVEKINPTGGSRLAKAATYAINQKTYTENYLLDGRCSISNNLAENIARPYAVGRKNFLFHDTVKGAEASSIIYSLVETAKANNLNILKYLETVLLYMPDYNDDPENIEELLPWSDMIKAVCRVK